MVDWTRYSLLRQERPKITISLNAVLPGVESAFSAQVKQTFRAEMTVEQKVEVAQSNALSALATASNAISAIGDERRAREQALASLHDRVSDAEASTTAFARTLVVDGIPLAMLGLALTGAGLLLQTVASLLGAS